MATTIERDALLMASLSYQATTYYRTGKLSLPSSCRLIGELGTSAFPRLGFAAVDRTRIFIVFRGTEDFQDLLKDLSWMQVTCPYGSRTGSVHQGFLQTYERGARYDVYRILRRIQHVKPRKQWYVAGHSLGGALATLCALDLSTQLQQGVPLSPRLFTFGSPRVGNPAFAAACRRRIKVAVRVYNPADWVTRLPPETIGPYRYRHVGRKLPLSFHRYNPFSNHSISGYYKELAKRYS